MTHTNISEPKSITVIDGNNKEPITKIKMEINYGEVIIDIIIIEPSKNGKSTVKEYWM